MGFKTKKEKKTNVSFFGGGGAKISSRSFYFFLVFAAMLFLQFILKIVLQFLSFLEQDGTYLQCSFQLSALVQSQVDDDSLPPVLRNKDNMAAARYFASSFQK